MIKLQFTNCPTSLTETLKKELTVKFIDSGKKDNVWNLKWLKKEIFNMSFGKCCYSEVKLGTNSTYLEVEHFLPKSKYPELVIVWGNLLPSCKTCNASKKDHDPRIEDIVNPFIDNPKDYFYFRGNRYVPRNAKGRSTIDVLDLNNHEQFVKSRFFACEAIMEFLSVNHSNVNSSMDTPMKRRNFVNRFKALLRQGNRTEIFSASIATCFLESIEYQDIKNTLILNDLWDADFIDLNEELQYCALL